jgi:hypothetical protein
MSETSLAVPDGIRLSEWWESRGLSRSTAFRLLKLLGIEPAKVRAAGSRSPVSFLSDDQVLQLDGLAQRLRNGATLAQLEGALVVAVQGHPETASDGGADLGGSAAGPGPEATLTRLQALALALDTGAPLTTGEVSWLLGARPGAATVQRGRVVADRQGRNCWSLARVVSG